MNKTSSLLFIAAISLNAILLSGCASVIEGRSQKIQVCTQPEVGAQCYLQNNHGKVYLSNTPGIATVPRSYQDLIITAQKPGYIESIVRIKSKTNCAAFGNVLLGGAIGAGVDCADGAAYSYPEKIVIPMHACQE